MESFEANSKESHRLEATSHSSHTRGTPYVYDLASCCPRVAAVPESGVGSVNLALLLCAAVWRPLMLRPSLLWASWSMNHVSRCIFSPIESYAECPMHLGLFLEFSLTEPRWMPSLAHGFPYIV